MENTEKDRPPVSVVEPMVVLVLLNFKRLNSTFK